MSCQEYFYVRLCAVNVSGVFQFTNQTGQADLGVKMLAFAPFATQSGARSPSLEKIAPCPKYYFQRMQYNLTVMVGLIKEKLHADAKRPVSPTAVTCRNRGTIVKFHSS